MNFHILRIAFSNIMKHRRRTFFNVITFMANSIALLLVIGMIRGMYNQAFERTIELDTGHFKVYNRAYAEDRQKMPIEYNIRNPYEVIEAIKGIPHFVAAAPRIQKFAVLSDFRKKTNVMMTGVDMEAEIKAMKTLERVPREAWLPRAGGKVLIGKKLASLMAAEPGDAMLLYSQTVHKANNLADIEVAGHYTSGFAKMEKSVIFVPFGFASEFLDMDGAATEIVVRIEDKMYILDAKRKIESILAEKFPDLTVRDWTQEAAGLIEGAKADFVSYSVLFAILLFLAVFIITNTLTITVFERTAEIGTLRAIGMERGQIGWMFMWEGLLLSLGGAIAGGLISIPIAIYMNTVGITYPPEFADKMPFPIESMTSKNDWTDWLIVALVCLVTGVIGALKPAKRAADTNIVEALKKGVR